MMKSVKKEVEIVETEGLAALLGERIVVLCMNYIYAGTLEGVNQSCILLSSAKIVYSTGEWSDDSWNDAQALPTDEFYIQMAAIESFGKSGR
jgi:hypothetical protein